MLLRQLRLQRVSLYLNCFSFFSITSLFFHLSTSICRRHLGKRQMILLRNLECDFFWFRLDHFSDLILESQWFPELFPIRVSLVLLLLK